MGKLSIEKTKLVGVNILTAIPYIDDRGEFQRLFCEDELNEIYNKYNIKQINRSLSYKKGTTRGLHFQYAPDCEVKIIKCIRGSILDIVVDIRKDSPTFLQSFSIELSKQNNKMIFIEKGFAHGFQTLEDDTELLYLHSDIYTPNNEGALNIKDPILNIKLPYEITEISQKDENHKYLDTSFKGINI